MDEMVIGIDIGTSATKGVLAGADGSVVETARREHETSFPKPGYAEHDADKIWWTEVVGICRELATAAKGAVAGLCISGIGPCLLPTDEKGMPLRPAILYGVDTRSAEEITELRDQLGYDEILHRCGNDLTTQSLGPKIMWMRKHEPEIWARTRRMLMASTYCIFHLTGAYVLDRPYASSCEPMYSPLTNDWIPEWAELIAPGLELPELKWCNEVAGYITDNASRITGIAPGTPVAMGGSDAWAESLSVGVRDPGDAMVMYGSTLVADAISTAPLISPNLWSLSGLFRDTYILGGGMSTTGSLTTWVKDLTGKSYVELLGEAEAAAPGSNGLVTLPYFSGERSPIADPHARGVMCGLSLAHGRGEIYRSMLEATGYGARHMFDTIAGAGGQLEHYKAVGGGTRGGLWPQIMSDVMGIDQEISTVTLGACYGDALLAAMAADLVPEDTTWNSVDRVITPNDDYREIYDQLYHVYRELYEATAPFMHTLAALQK